MDVSAADKSLNHRSAGILMHITSLPGPAYIGDIGPAAIEFAEFLNAAGQSVWQMLPVQPAGPEQSHSPYSASSALAGNPVLISPQLLARDGWINSTDIKRADRQSTVNYQKATGYKEGLLRKAWLNWKKKATPSAKMAFTEFCAREQAWLDDYVLFTLIKEQQNGKAWTEWPEPFKKREKEALDNFRKKWADDIDRIRWVQMIFDQQWTSLHKFCQSLEIRLIGDVPIYVAFDSADVWSHNDLFTIDEDGRLTDVAGVPPDIFNSNGQLWGMPLYNWDKLKSDRYTWWVQRLRKNMRWFDLIRLDHFRGFSSYWSIPASASTAKEGRWITGPGNDFFDAIKEELGHLSFIAEDLGEIDQPVYNLRDAFNLPGMNVLQFAFGDDMPKSNYLPHNYIRNSVVYTGTHDNDTTVGWFKSADRHKKQNLSAYLGSRVNADNVADQLIRLAYMSISEMAVIPMQDILSLGGEARMNMPATSKGNWEWRMQRKAMTKDLADKLAQWTHIYDRRLV